MCTSCGAVLIHLQLSIYIAAAAVAAVVAAAVAAARDGSDRPDAVGVDVAVGDDVVFSVGRVVARNVSIFLTAFLLFSTLWRTIYRSTSLSSLRPAVLVVICIPANARLAGSLFLSSQLFNRVYAAILEIEIRRNRFCRLKWLASIFRQPSREKYANVRSIPSYHFFT